MSRVCIFFSLCQCDHVY